MITTTSAQPQVQEGRPFHEDYETRRPAVLKRAQQRELLLNRLVRSVQRSEDPALSHDEARTRVAALIRDARKHHGPSKVRDLLERAWLEGCSPRKTLARLRNS